MRSSGRWAREDRHGGQHLQRRRVAAAGHDHVRLRSLVVARPLPDAQALGAVDDGLFHREPLRHRVLAGDDDVHVMPAAQAMVEHRQQAIGVRRQVHPHHVGLLVDHVVQEAGVLVGEAVMVLLPDMGGEQVVQRRDLAPPGQLVGHLQPLGMLAEHGVDDADEGFVAVEQAVPPGQQVAFQPALTLMLAQHGIEHAAIGRQELVLGHLARIPLPACHLEHGVEHVGERLVRAEDAEVARGLVQRRDVAQEPAEHPRVLGGDGAGRGHRDGVGAEVRHPQVAQQRPAVGVWVGPHAAVALGRQFGQFGDQPALFVEQLLRPVAAHPALERGDVVRMGGAPPGSAPGARGTCPRSSARPAPSARSTLSASEARSSASAGATGLFEARALSWISLISPTVARSTVSAISLCMVAGSSPSTK